MLVSKQPTEEGRHMTYRGNGRYQGRRPQTAHGALVTPRQMAALDKMAAVHGFASGSALLCDVASCDAAELGRKSRSVVQMFVDQAFTRYGRASQAPAGELEAARQAADDRTYANYPRGNPPAGASAWAFANAEAESMRAPVQAPPGADLRAVSAAAGSKYAYTADGARMTVSSRRCEDAPCCGCCD